ncbi:Golgi SNAP receptor complex member 1 [Spathaspora sp. JA1]|nr:Golgi SNAP receptor complex member 1 [Spathaspora sp. JA1]
MSSSTFTQTRSQALNLEKQTEQLLSQYSQFLTQQTIEPNDQEITIKSSIQDILDKRDSIINKLNRIGETMDNLSTSKLQQLTRHREILHEHKLSFNKIQDTISQDRNRNNLLFSVRSDINAHRQQQQQVVSETGTGGVSAHDYILDESQRVDSANSFAERLLQSAFNTRDELINQRQYLNNAQAKMFSTLQHIPGLNVLISKINTRRKRDTLILATVIALCILLLFFF